MARTQAVRITRPARLGLIALLVIIVGGAATYFGVKYGRGTAGYRFAVRFPQAAGVASGAQVYLNGVVIGNVTKVKILPDTTVDFIITVFHDTNIPKNARFTVQGSSITGGESVAIQAPAAVVAASDALPKRVLPVDQQPVGTPPLTLETFMGQSRGLGDRAYAVLAKARPYGKSMLVHVRRSQSNAAATSGELRSTMPAVLAGVQSTIARAKANAQSAQAALRDRDQPKLAAIAQSFTRTSADMKRTADALSALKRDPSIAANVRGASAQLHAAAADMAQLSHDMSMVTGNPQIKAELRDAGARLRALLHKI
jgi:ABC-type transporter Mla subunit MlaD